MQQWFYAYLEFSCISDLWALTAHTPPTVTSGLTRGFDCWKQLPKVSQLWPLWSWSLGTMRRQLQWCQILKRQRVEHGQPNTCSVLPVWVPVSTTNKKPIHPSGFEHCSAPSLHSHTPTKIGVPLHFVGLRLSLIRMWAQPHVLFAHIIDTVSKSWLCDRQEKFISCLSQFTVE